MYSVLIAYATKNTIKIMITTTQTNQMNLRGYPNYTFYSLTLDVAK